METKKRYDYVMKLIILGDSGVGKTCLLMRFAEDRFTTTHLSTIGIDFKIKVLTLEDKTIKLQVWDTAGQEQYRTITQTYYKGAMGIILAYDCTEQGSFDNIKVWVEQIRLHATPNVALLLIATKCDRPDRKITYEEGKDLADTNRMHFFETSAKSNMNVQECFLYLANEIMHKSQVPPSGEGSRRQFVSSTMLEPKETEKNKRCC